MAWIKSGISEDSPYIISDTKAEYHYTDSVSLEDLNNEENGYRFVSNPAYVVKGIKRSEEVDLLPKGVYMLNAMSIYDGIKLYPLVIKHAPLFEIGAVKYILEDFKIFKREKEFYQKLDIPYKRGILLYGPPGTGKTSAINMVIDSVKDEDCIVIYIQGAMPEDFMLEFKNDQRLKIFIFEEFTETLNKSSKDELLNFLDGHLSLENTYIIATTNYPETLPINIVERHSRFDELIEVDDIPDKDRKTYIEHYLKRKITEEELKSTKQFPFATLKELILIMLKENKSFEDAVKKLNHHKLIAQTKFRKIKKDKDLEDDIL